jgi:hypothetical protein
MSDKKKQVFTKISKFIGAFSRKGIELPKYISAEEMSAIIKRGTKSTNNIKRFRNIESFTPSPSHDRSAPLEKSPEPHPKSEESYYRNTKTRESQQFSQKILNLKIKNQSLKETMKDLQSKHQTQLINLKRENEKLLQSLKTMKKEHFDEKMKIEDLLIELKKEHKTLKENFEVFVHCVSKMVENHEFCLDSAKKEFNKLLFPFLPVLSSKVKVFLFPEPQEFITTGAFGAGEVFSDTIESCNTIKDCEAIVLKSYKAQAHGELDLKPGDRVVIIKSDENSMWLGKVNEKVGLFPSSHVMLD